MTTCDCQACHCAADAEQDANPASDDYEELAAAWEQLTADLAKAFEPLLAGLQRAIDYLNKKDRA